MRVRRRDSEQRDDGKQPAMAGARRPGGARPDSSRRVVQIDRGSWSDTTVAALIGLATVVVAVLAAIESAEPHSELAIGGWWAWLLAAWGLIVAVVALVPSRRGRVERVVETH
jgi:hypothetical protein